MIDPNLPIALLGGMSPATFMKRYWQKKPLLIRQAIPNFKPPVSIAGIKKLARADETESRLIWREEGTWQMEHGPFARLPRVQDPEWSLLVQGLNLHSDAAQQLLERFRFVPDARLDDVMVSVAGDGGGVGPHFDSYDVFLLQGAGRRLWRIGRQRDLSLEPDMPLKILRNFVPEEEFVLEPGDMLYLPPQLAHDGIAQGADCMTISIGFRAPSLGELARGVMEHAADDLAQAQPAALSRLYRDPDQTPVANPALIPDAMIDATLDALQKVRLDRALAARFLGAYLTEPKPGVVFEAGMADDIDLVNDWPEHGRLMLDRRSQMLYQGRALYVNGECAPVPASRALQRLADQRYLDCTDPLAKKLGQAECEMLADCLDAGWLKYVPGEASV